MARGKGSSRSNSSSSGSSTMIGVLAGVVLGLLVAAGVAVYISGAPIPFVDRTSRAPDPLPSPLQVPRDPNAGLSSAGVMPPAPSPGASMPPLVRPAPLPNTPTAPSTPTQPPQPSDALGAFVASLGNKEPTAGGQSAAVPPAIPTVPAGRHVLQVGAFRVLEDAEALKARLALLGFEARVQQAMVNGVLVNRVQVGPYANAEAMNKARERLAANQVQSTVVRQ